MKKLLVVIVLLGALSNLKGQDTAVYLGCVITDKIISERDTSSDENNSFSPVEKSRNVIELRFSTSSNWGDYDDFILAYNTKWTASYHKASPIFLFPYEVRDSVKNARIDITNTTNLDSFISKLVTQNIFCLPDQDELHLDGKMTYFPKSGGFGGESFNVVDGGEYVIEFKIGMQTRKYHFYAPDAYAEFYPAICTLRNYVAILSLFDSLRPEEK